jgi:hypothetical protein
MKSSLTRDLAMMATFSKHLMSSVRNHLAEVLGRSRSWAVLVALARVEVWSVVGTSTAVRASSGAEMSWAPPLARAQSEEGTSRTVSVMLKSTPGHSVLPSTRMQSLTSAYVAVSLMH